jgi:AcrR family transcriptional regulator
VSCRSLEESVVTATRAEPGHPGAPSPAGGRRERARAATIEEIKDTARRLMRDQQTTDVTLSDIARAMGMTPPALYRYFDDRDDLLSALITDAFRDLGGRLAEARESVPGDDLGGRWMAAASAYRRWASSEPQQFALILGLPVPGYVAPEEGPTTEAAKAAMAQLADLFVTALSRGQLGQPLVREVDPSVVECAHGEKPDFHDVPPENFQAMLHAWASLHGFTSLEAYGHLDWIKPEARDAVFRGQVRLAAMAAGLPTPPGEQGTS